MPKTVLFLCTGNFYRSRFAEILFNTLARQTGIRWVADSRALAMERGVHCNFGPLSPHAADALQARGIDVPADIRFPQQLTGADLEAADLVIALKEAEHRPMLIARFPDWVNRVEYWHVHDLDQSPPQHATAEIEILVRTLLTRLARKERA